MKPVPVNLVEQEPMRTGAQTRAPDPNVLPRAPWGKAEALERLDGDEDLLRELCEIFLEESPKLLQKLGEAIAESDAAAVMRAAHSLKGELGYLGAAAASQASASLEAMGIEKNLSDAVQVFAFLQEQMAALRLAIKEFTGAMR
ncbi:MAG: Hpt domain-containing protein [Terriglobales bacterium]